MHYIVLNRCTWFFSNFVQYQTASLWLGFLVSIKRVVFQINSSLGSPFFPPFSPSSLPISEYLFCSKAVWHITEITAGAHWKNILCDRSKCRELPLLLKNISLRRAFCSPPAKLAEKALPEVLPEHCAAVDPWPVTQQRNKTSKTWLLKLLTAKPLKTVKPAAGWQSRMHSIS